MPRKPPTLEERVAYLEKEVAALTERMDDKDWQDKQNARKLQGTVAQLGLGNRGW